MAGIRAVAQVNRPSRSRGIQAGVLRQAFFILNCGFHKYGAPSRPQDTLAFTVGIPKKGALIVGNP